MTTSKMETLVSLLRCPRCSNPDLLIGSSSLKCPSCSTNFTILEKAPVFLVDSQAIKVLPLEHSSNQLPDSVVKWLKELDGYSLNIGAGATQTKIARCVELEYAIFKHTDVVGDAHCLPFKDACFDAVVAFNVFEHLHDPIQAAQEIFRVLKPGGKVLMQTAFLQPLHEEPIHFYNATKYGVMKWFSDFDIEVCQVSDNFNPALTLGWISSEILRSVEQTLGEEAGKKLENTTLGEWKRLWTNPEARKGFLWSSMLNLPQAAQEKVAAGFELEAIKPGASLIKTRSKDSIAAPVTPTLFEPVIEQVKIFATSLGNHFMLEIAQVFAEGFKGCGVACDLAVDEIPVTQLEPGLMQIVVAPHEFYNLFLLDRLSQAKIHAITKAVYMLSAEQPCTPWFDIACQRSDLARGVLDITQQTTNEYRKRGIRALHLPLGYAPLFEEGGTPHEDTRPLDLVFLGSNSHRRELFLSQNSDLFNKYNSQIVITRLEKPKFANTVGFYANHARNQLLGSCKILVNIHYIDNAYFEWLRVMMAIANRCLFISEASNCIEPLVNGKHLIITDIEDVPSQCEYYLNHEEERLKIVNEAYEFVTREFNSKVLCQAFLEALKGSALELENQND